MDEYSDMVAVAKPVVYITVGELINTHRVRSCNLAGAGKVWAGKQLELEQSLAWPLQPLSLLSQLLLEHQNWIAPNPQDHLHQLLKDLGKLPTISDLIGTYCSVPAVPKRGTVTR